MEFISGCVESDSRYSTNKQMVSPVGVSAIGRKGPRERDEKCHRGGTGAVLYTVRREGRPLYMQSEQIVCIRR